MQKNETQKDEIQKNKIWKNEIQKNEIQNIKNAGSKSPAAGNVFEHFCEVVAALRSENGCPWDRAQTFESLKPCMINEMTEAIGAIDLFHASGSPDNLCEELGDVLLQVVLLAQIADEEGLFRIEDVIEGVAQKMIRRHPHVFGEKAVVEAEEVPGRWEEIKRQEKSGRSPEQKAMEKEAFRNAAGQVIRHLESR